MVPRLKVFTFSVTRIEKQLETLVLENQDSHFFMDEAPVGVDAINASFFNELAKKIPKENYFWIAAQGHREVSANSITGKSSFVVRFRENVI